MDDLSEYWRTYNKARTRGDTGEVITANRLRKELDLTVVRNVYIPTDDGNTEIDMIAISEHGIFVIENKNYSGVVYGDETSKYWTVDYGGKRESLFSPVKQNTLHVKAVSNLLNNERLMLHNVIIFNDDADIRISGINSIIFKLSEFIRFYNRLRFWKKSLNEAEVVEYANLFRRYSDLSDEAKERHVIALKSRRMHND